MAIIYMSIDITVKDCMHANNNSNQEPQKSVQNLKQQLQKPKKSSKQLAAAAIENSE